MQDRFKFRVWHKKRKKMYDVLHFFTGTWNNGGEWVTAKGFNIITQQDINIQVEPKDGVIIQCTGLRDKNGKLIYEGDIVKYFCPAEYCSGGLHKCPECYSGENGSVHYDEDLAMYEYRSESGQCPLTDNINTEEDLEIIGNIYENPELLKDGE